LKRTPKTSGLKSSEFYPALALNEVVPPAGGSLPASHHDSESSNLADNTLGRWFPSMTLLALIVDDSMLIRHTVRRVLEKRGFQVETVSDGLAALEALNTIRPSVIFTDLQMPRLSGPELIDALHANTATSGIPIVVLAAKPSSGDIQEKRAHAVIYKDMQIEEQMKKVLENLFPSGATA
jgi:CheY-like chemotaxis protein